MGTNETNQVTGNFRNPREIKSVITKSSNIIKTLSIENYLAPVDEKRTDKDGYNQNPLEIFAPFSVFRVTLIEKNGDKKNCPYANIPICSLASITAKTQIATRYIMENQLAGTKKTESVSGEEGKSIAYRQVLAIGEFKGKTPAQVLSANAQNKEKLANTANWLKERMLYKGNSEQYDAIMDALTLLENGKLDSTASENTVSNNLVIPIYQVDIKTLKSTKEDDGKQLVYSIAVECIPDHKMPYRITIRNYRAVCNGIIPDDSTREKDVKVQMAINEEDWLDIVQRMNDNKELFTQLYGKYQYGRMIKAVEKYRKE